MYHPLLGGTVNAKRTLAHVEMFRVERLDGPMHVRGFKGDIEPSAELRDIAEQWGDGHYRLSAINGQGVPIASKDHRISLEGSTAGGSKDETSRPSSELLEALRADKQAELGRLERMIDQAQVNAQRVTDVVTRTADAQIQREKLAAANERERQEGFMGALLSTMQQGHQQQMAMLTTGFQQSMALMQAQTQRNAELNDPSQVLGIFTQALELGRDMSGGGDTEPWVDAIREGVKGLGQLNSLARANGGGATRAKRGASASKPSAGGGDKTPALNRAQLTEVVKLKRMCDANGFDFDALLQLAQTQCSGQPAEDEDEATEEGTDAEEATAESTAQVV